MKTSTVGDPVNAWRRFGFRSLMGAGSGGGARRSTRLAAFAIGSALLCGPSAVTPAWAQTSVVAAGGGRIEFHSIDLGSEVPAPGLQAPAMADPRAKQVAMAFKAGLRRLRIEQTTPMTFAQGQSLEALQSQSPGPVEMYLRPGVGTPRQLKGRCLQRAVSSLAPGPERDRATAQSFLRQQRQILLLEDPDQELVLKREMQDELGRRQLRFGQQYQGIPVWPAELIVHLDPQGDVDLLGGGFVPTPLNAVTVPRVSAEDALLRASAEIGYGQLTLGPELVLFATENGTARLGWRMEMELSMSSHRSIVVDALFGGILRDCEKVTRQGVSGSGTDSLGRVRALDVWQEGGDYLMVDTSKPMYVHGAGRPTLDSPRGSILVLDLMNQDPQWDPSIYYVASSSPTYWSVPDSVGLAFTLSETYDYYLERHGRNSLDGDGGALAGIVRCGQDYYNAFWNGEFMVFGDAAPFACALDVVAHEFTHGVVEHTANLEYQFQSGALNEAFADIFGQSAEARTEGVSDWLMGEDIGDVLRNLANPGALGWSQGPYPSKMSEFYVLNGDQDYGGVHINCTIVAHAFYLLAEGLNGSIGLEKAEWIFYRALSSHLVMNSQFIDARLSCIASAEELFGASSVEALITAEAFDAVEIGDGSGSGGSNDHPGVDADDSLVFLYRADGAEDYRVGRREDAQGDDPTIGVGLISSPLSAPTRIHVQGDGEMGIFVSDERDVVLFDTLSGNATEVGLPGEGIYVSSVAMAPDGEHYAFVLLDGLHGEPTNEVTVIDIGGAGSGQVYTLTSPDVDGVILNTVLFADQMDFSADNRFLVYDAFNEVSLVGGASYEAWSIYALDMTTGNTLVVVSPDPDLDIGNPAISQTNDGFLTFEAFDDQADRSTIYAANVETGELSAVVTVDEAFAFPVYSGDDSGIVLAQQDTDAPTGFSLYYQSVSGRLNPIGSPERVLQDGAYGTVYRRGSYSTPNARPNASIDTPTGSLTIAAGEAVFFACTGNDPNGHYPLTYLWDFGGAAMASTLEDPGLVAFANPGTYTVTVTVSDSEGLADATPSTRLVTVTGAAGGSGTGGGGGGCVHDPQGGFDPTLLVLLVAVLAIRARRGSGQSAGSLQGS